MFIVQGIHPTTPGTRCRLYHSKERAESYAKALVVEIGSDIVAAMLRADPFSDPETEAEWNIAKANDWEAALAWLRTIAEDQDFDVSLDEMEPEDEREHAEQANEIIGDELAGGGVSLSTFSLGDVRMRPTKPGVNLHMLPSVIETSDDVSGLRPHQRDAYLNPPASMTFNPGLGKAGFGAREEVQPLDPADLVVSTLLSALADLEAVREAGEEVPALENARKAIAEGQAWRDKARRVGRIADDVVRLAGIIVAGTDLHACLSEAMDVHIYDADQGEAPDADCGYAAALKGWTDALAGITVTTPAPAAVLDPPAGVTMPLHVVERSGDAYISDARGKGTGICIYKGGKEAGDLLEFAAKAMNAAAGL